jgi:hypothetical protein
MIEKKYLFKDEAESQGSAKTLNIFASVTFLLIVISVIPFFTSVLRGGTDKKEDVSVTNNLARTVIFIEYRRDIADATVVPTPQGPQEAMLYYRVQGNPEYKPLVKTNVMTGTGFLVMHGDIPYIATARHVVENPPRTVISKGIYFVPSEGKVNEGDFEELSKWRPGARWFLHKIADVAVHPFVFPAGTTGRIWRVSENMLTPEPIELLTSVIVPGFPYSLGKDDVNLGPVLAIRDIVSWPIHIPNVSKVPEERYVLLSDRLAGGYSGSPVFTFRAPPTKFYGALEVKLAGIVSGYYIRKTNLNEGVQTQDELATIVPTTDLLELFGYPEITAFEAPLLEKIKAKKLIESQQKTNESPEDQKAGKGTQESPVK